MKLNLTTADKLTQTDNYRVFIYGDNRSGKTYFASTWPHPLFLVPNIAANEMRTVRGLGIPVVTFGDIDDCRNQVLQVADLVERGKPVGPWVPKTIIIDNLTSMITAWKPDLKPAGADRIDYAGWEKLASTLNAMMAALHTLDTHTIWVAHSKINTIKSREGQKIVENTVGGFTIEGSAKNTIPSHCDMLLYAESTDTIKGPQWWIYTSKKDIWNAGFRAGVDQSLPRKIGPSPHYDDFAKPLGLPSQKEAEK